MRSLKQYVDIISVNGYTAISLLIAGFTHFEKGLSILVLLSSLFYNVIKIYNYFKTKKRERK